MGGNSPSKNNVETIANSWKNIGEENGIEIMQNIKD
jgi:hypothetical protein